jgi:DNA-binding winged helix-turn-helix (wHTH) protein/Tol biopolymer transport system component
VEVGEFRIGPWLVQSELNRLSHDGVTTRLEPKVMDVLVCLARHPSQVVPKEQLIKEVWSDTFVTDDVLTRAISELRRVLEDEPKDPRFIQTIPKRGYRLLAPVSAENTALAGGEKLTHTKAWTSRQKIWASGGTLALLLLGAGLVYYSGAGQPPAMTRFRVEPPEGHSFEVLGPPGISPDGSKLLLTTDDAGKTALWLRPLNSLTVHLLPGTEGVQPVDQHAWSPDGRYVLFVAGGRLKKLDTRGGIPEVLCDLPGMAVGTWSSDGAVLLTVSLVGNRPPAPIQQLDPAACSLKPVTRLDAKHYDCHQWPSFLPDAKHFLFAGLRTDKRHDVLLGTLGSLEAEVLVHNASYPKYAAPGYLLYERGGFLFAQPFSLSKLRLTGDPVQVVSQQLMFSGLGGIASYDVSANGVLIYQEQKEFNNTLLVMDSAGKRLETLAEGGVWAGMRLAPDGKRLLAGKVDIQTHTSDLWSFDLQHRSWERLSSEASTADHFGVWSPDGNSIVYAAAITDHYDLFRRPSDPSREPEPLLQDNMDKRPTDWSPDGRFLLYTQGTISGEGDLWVLPMQGDKKPFALTQSRFDEGEGRFSPDGHWIAYSSDESGRRDVYVRSFLGASGKWPISSGGGRSPQWSADGKKIYYRSLDGTLVEARVKTGTFVEAGPPRTLFSISGQDSEYEVLRDGKFLVNEQAVPWSGPPTVVMNWSAALPVKSGSAR